MVMCNEDEDGDFGGRKDWIVPDKDYSTTDLAIVQLTESVVALKVKQRTDEVVVDLLNQNMDLLAGYFARYMAILRTLAPHMKLPLDDDTEFTVFEQLLTLQE